MATRFCSFFAVALIFLTGCSDARNTVGSGGGGGGVGVGQMYVSTPAAILRFSNALNATGNIAPVATITGTATGLSAPQRIVVDPATNRLFVANQGTSSILIFESASTASGNAAPTRTIAGAATLLSSPVDLALDTTDNILYVADGTNIQVFLNASTITGNVPPVHTINMGFAIGDIFVDSANNRLYVADTVGNAIDRLDGANAQNGAPVVGASILGGSTGLSHPSGLTLDGSDRLFVSNAGSLASITVYANASTAAGNVSPVATIAGLATTLAAPGQLVLNPGVTGGELYVADSLAGSITVFSNVAAANGNVAPTRVISGASTGLSANAVNGVALDPAR